MFHVKQFENSILNTELVITIKKTDQVFHCSVLIIYYLYTV